MGEEQSESTRLNVETMERNKPSPRKEENADHVLAVLKGLLWSIFFPEPTSDLSGTSFFHRTKTCVRRDFPRLRESSKSAGVDVLSWTRRGSPLRALLVLSGKVAYIRPPSPRFKWELGQTFPSIIHNTERVTDSAHRRDHVVEDEEKKKMGEEQSESTRLNVEAMERNKPSPRNEENANHLLAVLKGLLWSIFFPELFSDLSGTSFFNRTKTCVRRDFPRLRESSKSAGVDILSWTRRGSPLRALLVLSVGAISFLTLTGVSVFMLFFLTATVNAVVISLLVSLAAAGGALAIFFSCVAAIYIGALSVAVFVISVSTISAIIAVLITAGWVGFLWTIWLAVSKSASLAKHSIGITGSAISAYSARHSHRHHNHNG